MIAGVLTLFSAHCDVRFGATCNCVLGESPPQHRATSGPAPMCPGPSSCGGAKCIAPSRWRRQSPALRQGIFGHADVIAGFGRVVVRSALPENRVETQIPEQLGHMSLVMAPDGLVCPCFCGFALQFRQREILLWKTNRPKMHPRPARRRPARRRDRACSVSP